MGRDGPRANLREVQRLGKVLLLSSSPERRAWAARTLGEAGHASAYAYLRRALWDPEEAVRATVVDAIAACAVHQSGGELASVYAWSGPLVRRRVVRALRSIGDIGGILRMATEDPDPGVRALASRPMRGGARGRT